MADFTITVSLDAKGVKSGASEVKREMRSIATFDMSDVGSQIEKFGSLLSGVGRSLSLFVTAPLIALGGLVAKIGSEYETALNTFGVVTKATGDEMQRAASVAKELGADLSLPATSAKDAAMAMTELGKAGLTATQAMDAAKGVLQLAAAGTMDEARAAEIAANALNSFKLEASETVRIADLLAAAANASSAEVSDIAESMQMASAVFAGAKIPIEDLTAAISLMANAGIKGSDAGTSLKTFIQRLQSPTDAAADSMKALGIQIYDTQGRMESLPNIIGQFETALSGLTDEGRAKALNEIFGADAIRAAQILFTEGTEGFNKIKAAVTESGAAATLANAKMQGLAGAWEGFKSQLETVAIIIYERIKGPLTTVLQQAAETVGWLGRAFESLSEPAQTAVIVIAAIAAAIGPLLIVVGGVVTAIGGFIGGIASAVAAAGGFAALLSTIGIALLAVVGFFLQLAPVLVVVAAQVAALYLAWQTNFGGIRDLTATVVAYLSAAWDSTMAHLSEITASVTAEVKAFWEANGEDITQAVQSASDKLKEIWQGVVAFWQENGETIKQYTTAAWEIVKTVIVTAVRVIGNVIKLALAVINGEWSKAWEATKAIISAVVGGWVSILQNAGSLLLAAVRLAFNAAWSIRAWIIDEAIELGKALIQGIINGIGSLAGALHARAKSLGSSVIGTLKSVFQTQSPSKVTTEIGRNVADGLALGMQDQLGVVGQSAKALGEETYQQLNDFIRGSLDVLFEKGKSWGDKFKEIFGGIADRFKKMLLDMTSSWASSGLMNLFGFGNASSSSGGGGIGGFLQNIFGGGNISGPGGTAPFNPNAGTGTGSGNNAIMPGNGGFNVFNRGGFLSALFGGRWPGDQTGMIDAAGNIIIDGRSKWSQFFGKGGFFGDKGFGFNSGTAGTFGAIATLIGGLIGGRTGTVLSAAGTGASIGAMFGGPIGAIIGGLGGAVFGLFGINSMRRKEEKIRAAALGDALNSIKQFDTLIQDVRGLRLDPASGIAQGTALAAQIRQQYMSVVEQLKDKKTRNIALKAYRDDVEVLISQKMEELRKVADVATAAGDRERRLIPEFAQGVFLSPGFQAFRRMNGMLAGAWTGRDVLPAMLAAGEMVINPRQQERIRLNAGFDVFRGAGIPGYAQGGVVPQASPAVMVAESPVHVSIHLEQDASGQWHATAKSDSGRKVILDVVSDGFANDKISTKRR